MTLKTDNGASAYCKAVFVPTFKMKLKFHYERCSQHILKIVFTAKTAPKLHFTKHNETRKKCYILLKKWLLTPLELFAI